jgi:rRNA maturation endonuclease Nob1
MSESTPEIVSTETVAEQQQEVKPASNILKCLVIDTNAIINGMSLRNMAEEFYTCPEVLYELRSAHSKEFLSRLPFELKILNPTEESLKFGKIYM